MPKRCRDREGGTQSPTERDTRTDTQSENVKVRVRMRVRARESEGARDINKITCLLLVVTLLNTTLLSEERKLTRYCLQEQRAEGSRI